MHDNSDQPVQDLEKILVTSKKEWKETIRLWLPPFIRRTGMDSQQLSDELWRRFNVRQLPGNLRSKFSKGTVDSQLLLQIMLICEQEISLTEINEAYQRAIKIVEVKSGEKANDKRSP